MSEHSAFDFTRKLKDDETLLWAGRGSGRNTSLNIIMPMIAVSFLGLFLILGFPLSGFQFEMALIALGALAIAGIVVWFFRARMLGPASEEYAISSNRIFIVSGPIGRICRTYVPSPKKTTRGSGIRFYAVKHIAKRRSVAFLPARSKSVPPGYPPVFVGIENSLKIAELAAETFKIKLIKR